MNIFEYYGIKEVANVYFEALDNEKTGMSDTPYNAGDIILYLDTLKVTTVETTAENTSANGGQGNPKLITWDFGKDINVTLEDAVISFEELRTMLGAKLHSSKNKEVIVNMHGEFVANDEGALVAVNAEHKPTGAVKYINRQAGVRGQADSIADIEAKAGDRLIVFWTETRDSESAKDAVELVITPNDFPGTFKVVGDTLIRNKNGTDEPFQFVINKAKMLSEVTLTMQAEGDPSTFNMTLNVLRDDKGEMMSLIKY